MSQSRGRTAEREIPFPEGMRMLSAGLFWGGRQTSLFSYRVRSDEFEDP